MLLKENDRDWGPHPFRFINSWLLHPNFREVVKKSWEDNIIEGLAGFRVFRKLKGLKGKLKQWNHSVFGNIHDKVKSIEDHLHSLDLVTENSPLNDEDILKRKELKSKFWSALKRAEWLWHKKSRVDWALKGDHNTRYFHIIANERQRRNFLNSIMVEGINVENPYVIKVAVLNHFKSIFSEKWKKRPCLGGNFGSVIGEDMNRMLVENFSKKEIWSAIKSCDGNKAPSPNGFNILCLRKCWKIMKEDIIQLFLEFHTHGKLFKGLNASFIVLIPKSDNLVSIQDFRPIGLIGCIYKVLSKVLATRIKLALCSIIGEVQTAFVGGRHI